MTGSPRASELLVRSRASISASTRSLAAGAVNALRGAVLRRIFESSSTPRATSSRNTVGNAARASELTPAMTCSARCASAPSTPPNSSYARNVSTSSELRSLYNSSNRNSSSGRASGFEAAASRIVSSRRSPVCSRTSKRRPAAAAGKRMICPISRSVGGSRSNCPSPSLRSMSAGNSASRG